MNYIFRLLLSLCIPAALITVFLVASADRAAAQPDAIQPSVRSELAAMFSGEGCEYPPAELTMIALKEERRLEIWALDAQCEPRLVADYPIYAASGNAGPKLEQGDRQVPEGIYSVEYLNPFSRFHLSMKLDYPNGFDRLMAEMDGRQELGGDIFIHGNSVSTGCLAVGDIAIEEIYALVEDMEGAPVRVIIAPYDFRKEPPVIRTASTVPSWLPELYSNIEREMRPFRKGLYGRQALAK